VPDARIVSVRKITGVLCIVLLVLAACGGDDDDSAAPSRSSTSASSTTTTTVSGGGTAATTMPAPTTASCPPLAGGATAPISGPNASGTANLTNVALDHTDCTDRVVFNFTATTADSPGYKVEYQPGPITQDASGTPVSVAGGGYLVVRFEPAYGFDFNTGQPTYTGPNRLDATGAHYVRDVAKTGDFEAVLTWTIGVDQERPYRVTAQGSTTRTISIEIR
jgi:hypothetical protein